MKPSRFRSLFATASMKNAARALPGFRVLVPMLLLASPAFGQLTVDYDEDEIDSSTYDTSAPNDPLTLNLVAGAATQSGQLTGSGAVIKTGAGSLTLSAVNSHTGTTTISAGTLVAENEKAFGANTDNFSVIVDGETSTLVIPETVILTLGTRLQNGGTLNNQGTLTADAYTVISQAGGMSIINTGTMTGLAGDGVYINNKRFNYITNTGGTMSGDSAVDAEIEIEWIPGVDDDGWPTSTPHDSGLHLTNEDGGQIQGGVYASGGTDNRIVNTGGSEITGGIYIDTGFVRNEAGSTIQDEFDGITVGYGVINIPSTITNTGTGSIIEGGVNGISVTNKGAGAHTIINTAGGVIRTQGAAGEAGVLTSYAFLDWSPGTVINEADSLIEGRCWGVYMEIGGTVTNSGTITGALVNDTENAGIVFDRPDGADVETEGVLSNSGTINGRVRFTRLPGTINHSGTINGDVTMSTTEANRVVLGIGSFIDGDLAIGSSSSSTLILDGDTGTQLYSEAVSGTTTFSAGSLNKRGTGTWVLDRAFTYTGTTTISGGTLTVNAALASTTFNVLPHATLNGTGTINGNVVLYDSASLGSELNVTGTVSHRDLDPLLFVPNTNSDSISVYLGNTNGTLTPFTTIASVGNGPAFIAVRGDQTFAYVTLEDDDVVKVIDTRTFALVQTVSTGANPGGLALSPDGTLLYVANRDSANVSVFTVDPVTGEIVAASSPMIATGAGPRRIAFSPDGIRAYVVNQASDSVSVIDVASASVLATVPVGTQPFDLAVSPDGQRIYVSNRGAGNVSVIDASSASYDVVSTVATGTSPRGVVVSPNGAHFYVLRTDLPTCAVLAFNTADNSAIGSYNAPFGMDPNPTGLAITPDGKTLYLNHPATDADDNGVVTKFTVAPETGVLSSRINTATERGPGYPSLASNGRALLATGATFVANRGGALTTATGGTAVFTGGTLLVNGDNLTFNTPLTLGTGGGTINTGVHDATFTSAIAGSGTLTKTGTGTLTLAGANTFTGGTSVSEGTLALGHADALGGGGITVEDDATLDLGGFDLELGELTGAASFTLSDDATLTVGSDDSDTTFDGVLSGTGHFTKTGTGHLNLTGAHTYTGDTTVNGGKLSVNGSLASGSITIGADATLGGTGAIAGDVSAESDANLAPGNSIGTLNVGGDYTWNAGATLHFELGAAGASDRLAIGGALTRNGAGAFAFDFGGTGAAGTYTLLTFGSQSGFSAANFSYANLAAGFEGTFTLNATALTFTVTAIPEPPDDPSPALVVVNDLRFTFDGTPKSATATTVPTDLTVVFTYNGSSLPPTNAGTYTVRATISDSDYTGTATGTLVIAPAVATAPGATTVLPDEPATLSVDARGGSTGVTYQWRKNGVDLPTETGPTLSFDRVQPEHAGLYSVVINANGVVTETTPVPLALAFEGKLAGSGTEVLTSVRHPNGNIYDQVLLTGKAVSVKADPGEIVRVSYVDLSDDIVQVEFAGAGVLTLSLATGYTGPAAPMNYNQPDVAYMKGHATVFITGADETSHLTIFSVGRITAVNQGLFRDEVDYDGVADVALTAIASASAEFGGVRTGNASYADVEGWTGVYAPGVALNGPLFVGDIAAADDARGVLIVGEVDDARITGGDLQQANAAAVEVDGISELQFTAGEDSHGRALPAQPNRATLTRDGVDVTDEMAPH